MDQAECLFTRACNWIADNNYGLNLYVVPTTCYIVIISDEVGVWKCLREETNH